MTTSNGSAMPKETNAAAEVDFVLRRTGMPLTPAERERFIRIYPIIVESMAQLRVPESRYAEPAPIFPAAVER